MISFDSEARAVTVRPLAGSSTVAGGWFDGVRGECRVGLEVGISPGGPVEFIAEGIGFARLPVGGGGEVLDDVGGLDEGATAAFAPGNRVAMTESALSALGVESNI